MIRENSNKDNLIALKLARILNNENAKFERTLIELIINLTAEELEILEKIIDRFINIYTSK